MGIFWWEIWTHATHYLFDEQFESRGNNLIRLVVCRRWRIIYFQTHTREDLHIVQYLEKINRDKARAREKA